MKTIHRVLVLMTFAAIPFLAFGQKRNSISVEASYDYGLKCPLYGIGGAVTYDVLEKGHWTVGAGLGVKHIDTFLSQKGNNVEIKMEEWVLPLFARAGFNYGVGFLRVDAGYHFNIHSKELTTNEPGTSCAVSGFFFTPAIGIRFAKVACLSVGVTWMQKNNALLGKYVVDQTAPGGVREVVEKQFIPTAKFTLGVRF